MCVHVRLILHEGINILTKLIGFALDWCVRLLLTYISISYNIDYRLLRIATKQSGGKCANTYRHSQSE
jgi:hypothetical protein